MPSNQPTKLADSGTPQGLDPQIVNLARAIRDVESKGDYTAQGGSGEYGAYQFTAPTWDSVAPRVLGKQVPFNTASELEQNAVAYHYIRELKENGYNAGQIASIWNSGKPDPTGNVGVNQHGVRYDTPSYVNNVYQKYLEYKNGDVAQRDARVRLDYNAMFPAQQGDSPLVAGFKALGNLPSSAYGLGEAVVQMLAHPIQTIEGVGNVGIGALEALTGDPDKDDAPSQSFRALQDALNERYGTSFGEKKFNLNETLRILSQTATNDPFGFGADLAGIIFGGAGLAGRGAQAANISSKVAQTVTRPVGRAVSAPLRAFGAVDADALAASQRLGVELPAGAYTTSPFVRAAETIALSGAGNEKMVARIAQATEQMDALAQTIIQSTKGLDDLSSAGQVIAKGLEKFDSSFRKTTGALFEAIRERTGDIAAQTQNTLRVLDDIIGRKEAVADMENIKFFRDKLAVVLGGKVDVEFVPVGARVKKGKVKQYPPPTFETLKTLRSHIGEMIDKRWLDPFVKQHYGALKQMYGALSNDIRATIRATRDKQLVKMYEDANKRYAAGRKEISSQFARTIARLANEGKHSRIVDSLLKPSTAVEDIPRIMAVIGEAGAQNLRAGFIKRIFQGARNAEGDFTPQGINRQLKRYGEEKVGAILTPQQLQAVKDLGKLTSVLERVTKQVSGSQTAFILKNLAELGAVGTAVVSILTGNFLFGVKALGIVMGGQAASLFFASKVGQQIMLWGVTRGAEFAKTADAMGLKPPPPPPGGGVAAIADDIPPTTGGGAAAAPSGAAETQAARLSEEFPFKHYSRKEGIEKLDPAFAGTGPKPGSERSEALYPEFHTPGVYGYAPGTTPESVIGDGQLYSGVAQGRFLRLGSPEHEDLAKRAQELISGMKEKYGEGNAVAMNAAFKKLVKEDGYDGIIGYKDGAILSFEKQRVTSLASVIAEALKSLREDGGATISIYGDRPTSGFAFAPSKATEVKFPEGTIPPEKADEFVDKNYEELANPQNYIGLWNDSGYDYMDVSRVVPDEQEAVRQALEANQIGIYDLSTGKTKYLDRYEREAGGAYKYVGEDEGAAERGTKSSDASSGLSQGVVSGARSFIERLQKRYRDSVKESGNRGFIKNPFASQYRGEKDLTLSVLDELEGKSAVTKQYISDLTNSPEMRQSQREIVRAVLSQYPDGARIRASEFADKVRPYLLELTAREAEPTYSSSGELDSSSGRYEHIVLPQELRGEVEKYTERIYESPIKNKADDVHYAGEGFKGYFAHTRVEDLPPTGVTDGSADKGTRRVIEVQSDLFQRGRLEKEVGYEDSLPAMKDRLYNLQNHTQVGQSKAKTARDIKELKAQIAEAEKTGKTRRELEISRLEPYRNTWWERIVSEEIKRAAQEGKSKIQFPSGPTAVKIEGIGSDRMWFVLDEAAGYPSLTADSMRVGLLVGDEGSPWIITDVLGDGKFRAVPEGAVTNEKAIYDAAVKWGYFDTDTREFTDKMADIGDDRPMMETLRRSDLTETFDISSDIDTSNPIYKFYEDDVARFLRNKFAARSVTDERGVTWNEVSLTPDMAQRPISALGGGLGRNVNDRSYPRAKRMADFESAKELTPEERAIETKAFGRILNEEEDILRQYEAEFGKVVNSDNFKPFFTQEGYDGTNSRAIQEPSSYLAKRMWTEKLKRPGTDVVAAAGGSGVGKTSSIENLEEINDIVQRASIVYDSNFSKLKSARDRIAEAKAEGKKMTIVFVYRDPLEAFERGIIPRMKYNKKEMGRVVPNSVTAQNHIGAWEVIKKLYAEKRAGTYEMDKVDFRFVANTGDSASDARTVSLADLEKIVRLPSEKKLKGLLDKKSKELLDRGEITEVQYRALVAD